MKIIGESDYESILISNGQCYGFTSTFKSRDITDDIESIELISFDEEDPNRAAKMAVVCGVTGGWGGALICALLFGRSKGRLLARFWMLDGDNILIESEKRCDFKFVYNFIKQMAEK
ncbi:MAG: hypothetical protein E4H16_05370 [Candidatus Atribacteria bacterium]|nr:MAG: hypothetical protein E4H16_05370 [Candidatus Atribacteria bacterium]